MSKKTFECAQKAGAHFIVQLKKNHKTLYHQIAHHCDIHSCGDEQIDPIEKHHGRIEERRYEVFDVKEALKKWTEWYHICQVVRVHRTRMIGNQIEKSVHYYVSNTHMNSQEYANYIRKHWYIENKNHYIKDTAFREDQTTKRINPFNFSCLIDFCINLLRYNQFSNINKTIYIASLDIFSFMQKCQI